MPEHTASLSAAILSAWHPAYLSSFIVAAILLLILVRARIESNLPRNTLVFATCCGLLLLANGLATWLEHHDTARLLGGVTTLALGLMVLRLAGLTIFRVIIPLTGLYPPRILEDILLVLAYIVWGLICLSHTGVDLGSLVTTSAVITAIIAFSMQDTLGNILGGIALQLDDSIHIGDWVKVDDVSGRVVEVHWRHTAVRTRNGEIIVMPNSLLMKSKFSIISRDDTPQWRRWVYFSVSLDIAPQRVIGAVEKALNGAIIPLVSTDPAPNCVLMDFKEGIGSYAVRYWLTNVLVDDPTDSAVRVHIYAALQREGWRFVPPTMDIRLNDNSTEQENHKREKELLLRLKTLRRIDIFRHLSDEEINHMAHSLSYAPFAKGDVITRQGAVAHWLYVLIEGEAEVWYEPPGQTRRLLNTLSAGKTFGEMGMMTGEPRSATVIARTDAACYRIDKKSFESIIQSRPELAETFASALAERNRQITAIQQEKTPTLNHEQQRQKLLSSIRKFFRLDTE